MASVTRSVWHRLRSSVSVAVHGTSADAEILRQLSDVFKELAHLSAALEETKGKLDNLADSVNEQIENASESTELLGRLLQSARARIEVLEGARQSPT